MYSTQSFLDIEDILNDIIILKDGSACLILEVSAVNFGLFSEKEQEATIYAYAQLLNSLTFSIQIVVSSKRKDISDYLKKIDTYLDQTDAPLLKGQIEKYRDFVKAIVRQGNVLDKKFFISIPFSSLELGTVSSLNILGQRQPKLTMPIEDICTRATTNLAPKRDHLIRLLARIGLRAHQLNSAELLQLMYDYFNPTHLGTKVNFQEGHTDVPTVTSPEKESNVQT